MRQLCYPELNTSLVNKPFINVFVSGVIERN